MELVKIQAVRINAPEWFVREDFQAWLNSPRVATWHEKNAPPTEFSDAFTIYDEGEGPDWDGEGPIPEDIWQQITEECQKNHITYCTVWITNI